MDIYTAIAFVDSKNIPNSLQEDVIKCLFEWAAEESEEDYQSRQAFKARQYHEEALSLCS